MGFRRKMVFIFELMMAKVWPPWECLKVWLPLGDRPGGLKWVWPNLNRIDGGFEQ